MDRHSKTLYDSISKNAICQKREVPKKYVKIKGTIS